MTRREYDPAADSLGAFNLWLRWNRHRLLLAGAVPGDDETVDLFILWRLR